MSAAVLQKRAFRLNGSEVLCGRGAWFGGRPLATQFLNAYSLLIPEGERFVIRACSAYLDRVGPELQAELKALFFQESSHSRQHGRMVEAMQAQKFALDPFRKVIEWLSYRVLEPLVPPGLRLATAAAIEHHNAAIAEHFLRQGLLRGIREGELRRLFLWHFAEEIEHKEVVFRLLQRVSGSWALRALGLAASCTTFLFYLAIGTLLLALKSGSAPRISMHGESLFALLVKESLRYLRPGFQPRFEESRALHGAALAELDRLGAGDRALPAAFRERMAPSLERVRKLRAFFGAQISGYEGTWVHSEGSRKLNFCTYSYLGLLGHPRIQDAARAALERYGTGTHGVRLLGAISRFTARWRRGLPPFSGARQPSSSAPDS
jgi:predicted metal-dependent hydrolase